MNIFTKSKAYLALTPMERAILKAILGLVVTFLSLLLPYANDFLAGRILLDYNTIIHALEIIGLGALLTGTAKILSTLDPKDQELTKQLEKRAEDLVRNEAGSIVGDSSAIVTKPLILPEPFNLPQNTLQNPPGD